MKVKYTMLASAVALLALPAVASAHIGVSPTSAAAGGFAYLEFRVPHGCEDSPTASIEIKIPKSIPSVTPQRNPFWELSTTEGKKEPTELHGEKITRGVGTVTWTATEPLPGNELDVLGMSVSLPAGEGETLYFPAIQRCEKGITRWVQVPAEGESGEELDEPAPALELTAAEGGHGTGRTEKDEDAEGEDGDSATGHEQVAVEEADDDDDASKGLGIAGLIVGGLGLLAGGTALVRSRG